MNASSEAQREMDLKAKAARLNSQAQQFIEAASALSRIEKRQERIVAAAKCTCYSACLFAPITLPYMAYQNYKLKQEQAVAGLLGPRI